VIPWPVSIPEPQPLRHDGRGNIADASVVDWSVNGKITILAHKVGV
jgi:hypothetical protein